MGVFDFLRRDDDRDGFARRVMDSLRRRGWPHPLRYDPARFEVHLGGDEGAIYLGAVFTDWLKFPMGERSAQLDRAFAFVFEKGGERSWDAVRDRLLPLVRPRVFFENAGLSAEHDWRAPATMPMTVVAGPLCVLAAIDRDNSMGMVNQAQLDEWGKPFKEVLAVALENLRARSPCRFVRQAEGFHLSEFGDWYDASRLLLPDLLRLLDLRGDPVAIALVREGLVVAGSADGQALEAMAAFAEATFDEATRPISCAPLVFRDGCWRPFEPMRPALGKIESLWNKQRVRDYAQQGEMLEAHFKELGVDRFVAPLEPIWTDDGLRTWTSWAEGAGAVLPRADAVVLVDARDRALPRLWEDVEAIHGPFRPEGMTYPQRYSAPWPDAEALERLAAVEAPAWLPVTPA
jgi:hypothetical protein